MFDQVKQNAKEMLAKEDFEEEDGKLIQFYKSQIVDQVLMFSQVKNRMSNRDYMMTMIHWDMLNSKAD